MAIQKPLDPQDLPRNFNLVSTELDPETEYGRHFRHANYWTERIFRISFFLNIATIIFLCIGMVAFLLKPEPAIYGTTELGSLYPLTGITKSEAINLINQHQAQSNANSAATNNQPTNETAVNNNGNANTGGITAEQIIKNSNEALSSVPVIPGNSVQPPEEATPTMKTPLTDFTSEAAIPTTTPATAPATAPAPVPAPEAKTN